MKTKQDERAEVAGVVHDMAEESGVSLRGRWVSIETADPIYYGLVSDVTPAYYLLTKASWVADTGRKHAYARDPHACTEAEYIGDVWVERPASAIILHPVATAGKIDTKG